MSIRNLVYEEQESSDSAEASDSTAPATEPKKRPRTAAWPLHKTEGHVAAYLDRKKSLYRELVANVLDGMSGAYQAFRKKFGPTAITAAITKKVGTKSHRPCSKQDVEKTQAYQRRVQPLFKKPPRQR